MNPFNDMASLDRSLSGLHFLGGEPERSGGGGVAGSMPAIFMRKLSRNASSEVLRSMFLFAKDFIDAEFVPQEFPEDTGYLSAVARFRTLSAAYEAKQMLDGKPNTANEANMIAEVLQNPIMAPGQRRHTVDSTASRQASSSASSAASSNGPAARQSSRYNGTFQAMEKVSSPPAASTLSNGAALMNGDFPVPESSAHFQSLFSPQSPISNSLSERPRITGKSVINDDCVDEETGELLKDPVAYAKNGHSSVGIPIPRRTTNPQLPLSRFAGLSISTNNNITSPPMPSYTSPRSGQAPLQTPNSSMSPPGMVAQGQNTNYSLAPQHFPRHNYPPVNPADQNPPCNTLYVGNLPIDTSEDELKAMFSKQRGYKRLCFRTKQNGPMCFVEFEDISFATKALNELYGHPLHNSVKGGIRLSFSKNPLGVRSGQTSSIGPPTPMSPPGSIPGLSGMSSLPFATASGPPPGLSAPPGLTSPMAINTPTGPPSANTANMDFPARNSSFSSASGVRGPGGVSNAAPGIGLNSMNRGFPDYMLGR
ncbi:MAG: hypothetical protein M1819_004526 [Sarea resinae]|nr:MAG: hypothetical protein M1819_004526 [Sarea resinae]